jgi:hypothetical protein
MIISGFDATGTVLSTVVAVPTENTDGPLGRQDRFVERSRQPAAAPPNQLAVGNFDGDGKPDLLWHFQLAAGARSTSSFQLAYAHKLDNGNPITALFVPTGRAIAKDMFVTDLDGDGRDDAAFVVDETNGSVTTRRLEVTKLGTPVTPPITLTDEPCR